MPERVTFTRKSADRIAKVVKRVEGMPAAEPIQQRRRAGGYRMLSLFEVISVDSPNVTVDLKRVQDTDDNLNDRSETEDIAYDPDDAPVVGDRGLVVRLGDGTRFFFKRRAALNRVFMQSAAYVKSDLPTQTFGYPDTAVCKRFNTPSTESWIAIFKFQNVLPLLDPLPGSGAKLIVFPQYAPSGESFWESYNPGGGSSYNVLVAPYSIKQDFDISTVTYNSWSALTKQGMQIFRPFNPRWPSSSSILRVMTANNGLTLAGTRQGPDALDQMFDGTTYGIALWITSGTVVNGGYEEAGFKITRLGGTPSTWTNGFIDWGVA